MNSPSSLLAFLGSPLLGVAATYADPASKETGVYHQSPLSGSGMLYPPYGAVFETLSSLIRRIG